MKKFPILLAIITVCFFACKEASNSETLEEKVVETNSAISSSAAIEKNKDTTRKFIRSADIKFKTKNVIQTTYKIEEITNNQGGFVTFTELKSDINNVLLTTISRDSVLKTTHFTVSNLITLRVPNTKLDTTLKEIAQNVDFLDYRIIKADDVALNILSNNLKQKRSAKNEKRLTNAIETRGKKLTETTHAEEVLLSKEEQSDQALVDNLSLNDQVNFSTVTLSIYQNELIQNELIQNEKSIEAYEPHFGLKIMEAFKTGLKIIEAIILFITQIWSIIALGFLLYLLYKKFGHLLK